MISTIMSLWWRLRLKWISKKKQGGPTLLISFMPRLQLIQSRWTSTSRSLLRNGLKSWRRGSLGKRDSSQSKSQSSRREFRTMTRIRRNGLLWWLNDFRYIGSKINGRIFPENTGMRGRRLVGRLPSSDRVRKTNPMRRRSCRRYWPNYKMKAKNWNQESWTTSKSAKSKKRCSLRPTSNNTNLKWRPAQQTHRIRIRQSSESYASHRLE